MINSARMLLTVMLLFAGLACLAANVVAVERPNVVWLSCEDISPHLGCYGDPNAITPNIDQLAGEGARYRHAYTTAGVCAPCRSGIITGVYQSTLGTHHMRCRAQLPDNVRPFPTYLRDAGYYCTNNSKQDYQFKTPNNVWDESSGKAHWRNRPDSAQPFFAVFNFTGCHESGIADASKYRRVTSGLKDDERQDASELKLPPYYPDTPVVREDWKRNYELITAMDAWAGRLIEQLKADGLYEKTIIFFWSDHGVGLPRAKRWLYDSGTHVPLVIRVPEAFRRSGQAAPGSVVDELVSSIDFAPTVLKLANQPIPDSMQGRAFLGEQLKPPRQYVYGARDRMDERYDIIRSVRDQRFRYLRNYEPFKPYYQYMNTPEKGATMGELRRLAKVGQLPDAARLFMADDKPAEELYDLEQDPHEINNLANDPKYRDVLQRMRAAHLDWVADTRDLGLIPESEIERREAKAVARYNILLDADPNLVTRIRETANLASLDDSGSENLLKALNETDAIVRYWAAIGLGNLARNGKSPKDCIEPLHAALKDDAPCVRIAAARALLRIGETKSALETLRQELAGDQQWARLRAAIVLDEAEEQARPLIPDLQACLTGQPNKYITRVANRAINELLGTNNTVK